MSRVLKTAYELQDIIVAQARILHGPWPAGMTMFVFNDAYGWSATLSRAASRRDRRYRRAALDIVIELKSMFDLDVPRLPDSGNR
jgi:hypothetical protein